MVFLKEFFEKEDFEKNQQMTKKHGKFPRYVGTVNIHIKVIHLKF